MGTWHEHIYRQKISAEPYIFGDFSDAIADELLLGIIIILPHANAATSDIEAIFGQRLLTTIHICFDVIAYIIGHRMLIDCCAVFGFTNCWYSNEIYGCFALHFLAGKCIKLLCNLNKTISCG